MSGGTGINHDAASEQSSASKWANGIGHIIVAGLAITAAVLLYNSKDEITNLMTMKFPTEQGPKPAAPKPTQP